MMIRHISLLGLILLLTWTSGLNPTSVSSSSTGYSEQPEPVIAGKIAFTVLNPGYSPKPLYDLYIINADGTGRQLIAQGMRQPDIGSTGKIVANAEGLPNQENLYVMNLDGSDKREVSVFAGDAYPSWPPDGGRLLFSNIDDKTIVIQDAPDKGATRYTLRYDIVSILGRHPAWHPDERIIYSGCDNWAGCGRWGLYITDITTYGAVSRPLQLTAHSNDISPDIYGDKVAFMSDRDGNWEIYVINTDGSGLTRLTNNPANDGLPVWSPVGHMIAFLSDRDGAWAVWVINPNGSNQRKLFDLNGPMGDDWTEERISWGAWPAVPVPPTGTPMPTPEAELEPALPPISGLLAFTKYNPESRVWRYRFELYIRDLATGEQRQLIEGGSEPDFSPDGSKIAFSKHGYLAIINVDGTGMTQIGGGRCDSYPSWSSDGQTIAYYDACSDIIIRMNADSSGYRELGSGEFPSWSPKEDKIVYKNCVGGNCGLWTMNADGTGVIQLNDDGSAGAPDWAPDGQRIAFNSQRDGNWEVYMININDGQEKRLTDNLATDGLPAWAPDGTRIAFLSDRDGKWGIYVMNADGTNVTRVADANVRPNWIWEKMSWTW